MDLYEKIREYISSPGYTPQKLDELFSEFAGKATLADFSEAVAKLEEDGLLVYIKKGKIASTEAAGYLRGTFRSNARGFGFFIPDEKYRRRTGGDLYIASEDAAGAINDDEVLAVMTEPARSGNRQGGEGKIIRVLRHNMTTLVGTLKIIPALTKRGTPRYYIKPDDRHINFNVLIEVNTAESGTETGAEIEAEVKPGSKVEVRITEYPTQTQAAKGKIIRDFGQSDTSAANYAAILHENGIKTEFDADTLRQAEETATQALTAQGRLDLRDKLIITIDGAGAKDLDDAVSVERTGNGFTLGVHIADVSHYVRPKTALDNEALERGTSVYFADRVVPMLPEALSNGCCSLNAGTDKYTLSAFIELDGEGEIQSCEIKRSIINSRIRGVYEELNDILQKKDASPFYDKYRPLYGGALEDMTALYNILDQKSRRRGALEIETTESEIIMKDGRPAEIRQRERGLTERYIEQFMLCANEAVANWLYWQDMPCVYRIHENPSPEKIQLFSVFAHNLGLDISPLRTKNLRSVSLAKVLDEAKDTEAAGTVSYMLLRSLMKAKYSSTASPHFGLAIERYCHFTSPIRRYPDLAVHRIVGAVLDNTMSGDKSESLSAFAAVAAERSSENELKAVNAERAIEDLYKTIYMQDHVGEVFDGIISSVAPFGFFVELANTCEGMVPISTLDGYFEYDDRRMTLTCGYTSYSLGDKVRVKIENADIVSRKVDMRLVSERKVSVPRAVGPALAKERKK